MCDNRYLNIKSTHQPSTGRTTINQEGQEIESIVVDLRFKILCGVCAISKIFGRHPAGLPDNASL